MVTEQNVGLSATNRMRMPASLAFLIAPTFAAIRTQNQTIKTLLWEMPLQRSGPAAVPAIDPDLLAQVRAWLADYFTGYFRPVDFVLAPEGTVFQRNLWQLLTKIPPGQTVTYGHLARVLGSAPRAVGRGVGANPLPLLIPCHRVVAAGGLGGFSAPGGVVSKQWLLSWEKWPGTHQKPAKTATNVS